MPSAKNVSEIRAFTGFIVYYHRFIQNVSTILYPLNELSRTGTEFVWTSRQETAFNEAKKAFMDENCLAFYDPRLPLVLATDASQYGVGAVLSHRYPDGSERAIQCVSQNLNERQREYSQ